MIIKEFFMKLDGNNTDYNLSTTRQNINRSEFEENEALLSIFDAFDNGDGFLETKEVKSIFSLLTKIASSNKNGNDNTLEDCELNDLNNKDKRFKKLNLSLDNLKYFITKCFEINQKKVSEDFANDAKEYCEQTGRKQLENNSKLAFKKDPQTGREVAVLLYRDNKNKIAAQWITDLTKFTSNQDAMNLYVILKQEKIQEKVKKV